MTYKVLDSILDTLDTVPGLAGLLQLVGIVYTTQFVARRVVKGEKRDRVLTELQQTWAEISGNTSEPKPAAQSISQPAEPYLAKESEPRDGETESTDSSDPVTLSPAPTGVTPEAIIKADSDAKPTYEAEDQRKMFAGVTGTVQVLIPLTGVIDVEALQAKLEKDLSKADGEIKSLSGRLSNKGFVDKAPADVVQGARDNLAEAEKQAELLRERLAML